MSRSNTRLDSPLPVSGLGWQHALVFVTGAAVLSLEILGTRLIAPYYGATLFVWSSLITVTLVSLAGGYAAGGVLADGESPLAWLGRLLAAAGIWLLLIAFLRTPALLLSEPLGVRWGAFVAALLLLGVPLACLGAAGPLAIRLRASALANIGREVGGVSAASTLGSVAGALLTGFVLMPRVPLRVSIGAQAFFILLAAAACLGRSGARRAAGLLAGLAVVGGAWTAGHAPGVPGFVRERGVSFYGNIRVVDLNEAGKRVLYIDGIPNTVVDLRTLDSTSDYITSFELLPFLRPGADTALLIGMGGGSLVGRFHRHYGIATDVVEIDPEISRLAKKWFGFKDSGGLHFEDGRRYLERGGGAYNFIVIDAFNGDQHPYHLFSVEAFRSAKARLRPEGVLAMNVIGYAAGPRAELLRSVGRTLRQVFPHVKVFAANRSTDPMTSYVNLTFLASDAPLDLRKDPAVEGRPAFREYYSEVKDNFLDFAGGALITDDHNPIEDLSAEAFAAIRRRLFETRRDLLLD